MRGLNAAMALCMATKCISRPYRLGRVARSSSKPLAAPLFQVYPDRADIAHDFAQ